MYISGTDMRKAIGLMLTGRCTIDALGEHFITIDGRTVKIDDGVIGAAHVASAAKRFNLNPVGKAALMQAHQQGQINTRRQLFHSIHIAHTKNKATHVHTAAEVTKQKADAKAVKDRDDAIKQARHDRIMGKLPKISEGIKRLRAKVDADIKADGLTEARVAAAISKIIDETTMRVGSEQYATKSVRGETKDGGSQDSFGASSLRKQHVKIDGNKVTFTFPGKSRKDWQRTVEDADLADTLKQLMSKPGERLMQHEDEKGTLHATTENHVRHYMAPVGITPKNIRTHHGTQLAHEFLQKIGPAKTLTRARRNVKLATEHVSHVLGNTPSMAKQSYINHTVLESYVNAARPH